MNEESLNILMLGGAKRVSLATKIAIMGFRMGLSVNLFSWELDRVVPIAQIAEIVEGAKWSDPDVLEKLHEVVTTKKIHIIIPFVDGAIGVTARYRAKYGNVWAPVGTIESVEGMFDKVVAARLFEQAGLPIPATYTPGDYKLPLIAKPRCGSASAGIIVVNDDDEMTRLIPYADDYLLQEYVENREEITVDCYVTMKGRRIAVVPRLRETVVGGEVSRTITIENNSIVELSRRVLTALDLRGAVTLQFLIDKDNDRTLLMEVNPRFGGGVVCSIHAGANMPEYMLTDCTGGDPAPCTDWRPGVEISRYMQEVVFYNGEVQG